MSRIITVTSGKGGVGKTNITVNLALYLASRNYRVCLFDADMGLANADILLGLYPEYTLGDVLAGEKSLKDIIIKDCCGIDIIPGSSGVERLADPRPEETRFLIDSLSEVDDYDFFFFDTSAGISKSVISFCMSSPEVVLVVTPEPTSLTDAYSVLKVLSINGFRNPVMVAVNQCSSMELAGSIFTKLRKVVQKYLEIDILPIGTIPSDRCVAEAVREQKPLISLFPDSGVSKGIKNIGRHLINKDMADIGEYGLMDFWPKFLEVLEGHMELANKKKSSESGRSQRNAARGPKEQQHKGGGDLPVSREKADNIPDRAVQPLPQDIYSILENIAVGISAISSELSAIRKTIEMSIK